MDYPRINRAPFLGFRGDNSCVAESLSHIEIWDGLMGASPAWFNGLQTWSRDV